MIFRLLQLVISKMQRVRHTLKMLDIKNFILYSSKHRIFRSIDQKLPHPVANEVIAILSSFQVTFDDKAMLHAT